MAGMSEAAKYHAMRRRLKQEIKDCQRWYNRMAMRDGQVGGRLSFFSIDRERMVRVGGLCDLHSTLDRILHTEPE